jgi:hypothetical protein
VNDDPQLQYTTNSLQGNAGQGSSKSWVVTAEGVEFMVNLLVKLTPEQVRDLVGLCDTRILQYMSKGTAKRAYMWHSTFLPVPYKW